jgi:hypothetical protein
MTVKFFCKWLKAGNRYDEHYLEIGKYNEYYLPAINDSAEAWLIITDKEGVETKLHLKR